MVTRDVLFRTLHGSRLYGLAHEGSDYDWYEVTTKVPHARARWSRQSIAGEDDTFRIDLGTFLADCTKGVPQALEAMYAPAPEVDLISGLRAGFRPGTEALATYRRTMRHFIRDQRSDGGKRLRHAFRLALNAYDLATIGTFNPTLTPEQARAVTYLRDNVPEEFAPTLATELAWTGDLRRVLSVCTFVSVTTGQRPAGHDTGGPP